MSLKRLLAENDLLVTMSCYDALSARIVEQAGFPLCSVSGLAIEASDLGAPDLGLITSAEMVRRAGDVVQATSIPVICDADTGFGGAMNVTRTVRMLEAAGVAAAHIEDQSFPKRCGILAGKSVIGAEQAARKIRAAADARRSADFQIIARCDAKGLGVDEVIRRLNTYIENGADIGMLGECYGVDEYARICREVKAPILACPVDKLNVRHQPYMKHDDWRRAGVRIVVYWHALLFASIRALQQVAKRVHDDETNENIEDRIASYDDYADVVRLKEWLEIDRQYGGAETIVPMPGGMKY